MCYSDHFCMYKYPIYSASRLVENNPAELERKTCDIRASEQVTVNNTLSSVSRFSVERDERLLSVHLFTRLSDRRWQKLRWVVKNVLTIFNKELSPASVEFMSRSITVGLFVSRLMTKYARKTNKSSNYQQLLFKSSPNHVCMLDFHSHF